MKMVNLDDIKINAQCTINIFVEKDEVVNAAWEVMQTIGDRGWIEVTRMGQQIRRNRFKRSVDDATAILQLINEDNLMVVVGGFTTTCT